MDINESIRCAIDGDAILFIGAGLSFLAHRLNGEAVPDASSLIDILLEQAEGTGSKHSLDRVAGSVLRARGVDFVDSVLKSNFTVSSVDPILKNLYSLPWKRIYTTNYDNAVEVARSGVIRPISVTVDEPQSKAVRGSIIHLNGFISRIAPANLDRGLLLTDSSYASSRLVETEWVSFLQNDIRTSRTIIFAGYSLYDLDIERALLADDSLLRKAFFFISPTADAIERSTITRYGNIVEGGINKLDEIIKTNAAEYKPPSFIASFTNLRELCLIDQNSRNDTAAQILTEQLVFGRIPEQEVLSGDLAFEKQPFLVLREQDKMAQQALRQGTWRDMLFVGELASGKSASTLNFAAFLRSEGYRIYYAHKGTSLAADLHRLAEADDKVAVVFDGYSDFRTEISDFASRRKPSHRIILTESLALHELIGSFIEKTQHLGPVREIVLDRIAPSDVAAFENLTNFGGFWSERAGASISQRQSFISDKLEGSLYRLLIEIIKSEKVQKQIRDLLRPLSYDERASKVFCAALIINSLGFKFDLAEWQYLFDRQLVRRLLNAYADQVRHFIYSGSGEIYVRNGVLSSHVLHAFMDDSLVRECLTDLYERAHRSSNSGGMWRDLQIELTKFGSIESMFSGETKAANIFKYYDSIRPFGNTANNPDYWLQLGIAATVLEDLPRGRLCFDNAYAREKAKRNPNLVRIDNYFSRFQMRQAIAEEDPNAAFVEFIKANERLEKQIFLNINRHYPFKTGRQFADIAARHFDKWDQSQQRRFLEATRKILQKAEEWRSIKREINTDVEVLIKETTSLLKALKANE